MKDNVGLPELKSEFLFTLSGTVGEPLDIGQTPKGERRVFPITDGVMIPNVRMTLETDDSQLVFMTYSGMRHGPAEVMQRLARGEPVDASEYYFRINPEFETASSRYAWLNMVIAVGSGHRLPTGPMYHIYQIL
jgi:hypothetical protein